MRSRMTDLHILWEKVFLLEQLYVHFHLLWDTIRFTSRISLIKFLVVQKHNNPDVEEIENLSSKSRVTGMDS